VISSTYSTKHKTISTTYLIIFLLIIPKVNIINIPNYWQGIRVENFISLLMLGSILFNPKNYKLSDDYKFFLFCIFIFLSYLVGFISGISPNMIVFARIIEYMVFVIFFSNSKLDYKKIIKFLKLLIIINFVVSLLQYFELVGYFSSRGYYAPDYGLWKSAGIFSGSWESSFITSVLYFIIYHNDKKKINIYLALTLIILILANTRGVMVPFFLSVFFLYLNRFKINHYHLIILTLVSFGSYFFILKYFALDIFVLVESFMRLVFFNQNMFNDFSATPNEYYSWAYRLKAWIADANSFNTNVYTNLFGTGYTNVYYESFIIRILFANGIIGLLILFIFSLRIKSYMLFFLLLSGMSVDYVASFKMFITLFLYFKCLKFLEK